MSAPESNRATTAGAVSGPESQRRIAFECPSCGVGLVMEVQHAGRRAKCRNCGAVLTIPTTGSGAASGAPHGAVQTPPPPLSLAAPAGVAAPPTLRPFPSAAAPAVRRYGDLPWYRRGGVLSLFNIAALVTLLFGYGTLPCLPACIALATGDVYQKQSDGSLNKWTWPNKMAAYVLLLLNLIPILAILLAR